MNPEEIRALIGVLDAASTREEAAAWERLRDLGPAVVPYLAEAFPAFRNQRGRVSLVFHAIRHARTSDDAFQLGVRALSDKSTLVRHRACGLLAYSLRAGAIPHLKPLLQHTDPRTVADARAAIDAISHKNHHYFLDRDHTGRSFWHVNEGDGAPLP